MLKFSPTGLNLFLNCPRCFWLSWHGVKIPRGIFPSLPGGMDRVIKEHFDKYREIKQLPPEIDGQIEGNLYPIQEELDRWRSWKYTNLLYKDTDNDVCISGALDECVVEHDKLSPLDYKTRGSALKSDKVDYYTFQLSTYSLLLSGSGHEVTDHGYLLFFWPDNMQMIEQVVFKTKLLKIPVDMELVKKIIVEAKACIESSIPEPDPECEQCRYVTLQHINNTGGDAKNEEMF